jgi:tyrosine-protein kinase Etk/Wzc
MAQEKDSENLQLRVVSTATKRADENIEKVHFLEPFIVLAKRKNVVLGSVFVSGIIAAVVSLFLPAIYTSTTKIMPPQQSQSVATAVLGQLGPLAGMAGKDLGIKNPADIYVAMLRSRTIGDALIDKFKLMDVYKAKRHLDAEKRLESLTEIKSGKEGVISISVSDREPKRAAEIANAYVKELTALTQTLAVTEAGRRRLFFEREVSETAEELAKAEQALKKTQETTGIIQLDNQSKAMIESLTSLHRQVALKEAQVKAMSFYATPQNPDLLRAGHELSALREEVSRIEAAQGNVSLSDVPIRKVPEAALEYVRKLREVKYRESLLELLTKQYEIARIDEAKDAAIIQVMDKAYPPEVRSWPHRTLIVVVVVLVTFLIAIVVAFVLEATEHARRDPEFAARIQLLKYYVAKRSAS